MAKKAKKPQPAVTAAPAPSKKCDGAILHETAEGYAGNCKTPKAGKSPACSGPHLCTLDAGHAGNCDFGDVTA